MGLHLIVVKGNPSQRIQNDLYVDNYDVSDKFSSFSFLFCCNDFAFVYRQSVLNSCWSDKQKGC